MKKLAGFGSLLGLVLLVTPLSAAVISVEETFESSGPQTPFNGIADHVWTGSLGNFNVTDAVWPSTHDFAGSRSLRSRTFTAQTTSIITTPFMTTPFMFSQSYASSWSVFVSGISADITSTPRDFALLLTSTVAASPTNTSVLESGVGMQGYRLVLSAVGSQDQFWLQVSTGSGWNTIDTQLITAANVVEGWNLAVERDVDGLWSWGFARGALGTPVTLNHSVANMAVPSGDYTGMMWRSSATGSTAFGFDQFTANTVVPEPGTFVLLGLGGIGLGFAALRRRLHRPRLD